MFKYAACLADLGDWPLEEAKRISEDIFKRLKTFYPELDKNYFHFSDPIFQEMGEGLQNYINKLGKLGSLTKFPEDFSTLDTGIRLKTRGAQTLFQNDCYIRYITNPSVNSRVAIQIDKDVMGDYKVYTLELNISKILIWFFNLTSANERQLINQINLTLRHELLHIIDYCYNDSKRDYVKKNKDNSFAEYLNTETELKSWADSIAQDIINRHPILRRDLTGARKYLSSYTNEKLKSDILASVRGREVWDNLYPENRRTFFVRVYKRIQNYLMANNA